MQHKDEHGTVKCSSDFGACSGYQDDVFRYEEPRNLPMLNKRRYENIIGVWKTRLQKRLSQKERGVLYRQVPFDTNFQDPFELFFGCQTEQYRHICKAVVRSALSGAGHSRPSEEQHLENQSSLCLGVRLAWLSARGTAAQM